MSTVTTSGRTLILATIIGAFAAFAHARELQPQAPPGGECGFQGNGDMYGLGIRLAVYIQAFAAIVSNAYSQESAKGIAFANDFFQFAMLLGLTYLTIVDSTFEVSEAAIIYAFTICCGTINATAPAEATNDFRFAAPKKYNLLGLRSFMRHSFMPLWKLAMSLVSDAYFTWYWFAGIDQLHLSPCTGYGFFIVRVSLVGWARTLGKVVTISLILLDLYLLYHVVRFGRPFQPPKLWVRIVQPQEKKEGVRPIWWYLRNLIGLFVTCGIVAFYAVAVELMIRWNNVKGVNQLLGSVGQMVALLVAVGSLTAVILEWGGTAKCKKCQERKLMDHDPEIGGFVRSDTTEGLSPKGTENQVGSKEVAREIV